MKLNEAIIKQVIKEIESTERRNQRANDKRRWEIYNGNLEPAIIDALNKEFYLTDTIEALIHRMVPINIVQKIINKLAGLYIESPERKSKEDNELDNELISEYEEYCKLNQKMKEANRYFKLFKRNLMEVYVDNYGYPKFRNLPRHTYEVFSFDPISPEIPEVIVKIYWSENPQERRYAFWTSEDHLIVTTDGHIDTDRMNQLNNTDGINPYGALPFVYLNSSSYSVNPEPDDDLLRMGVLIPILLSDMAFACKYQTWSIIYTIGCDTNIKFNPNSVVSLPMTADGQKPEIGTIKPQFDSDKMLSFIESLIATLLTTKNLSVNAITGKMDASSPSSGIAKALDESQSVEDKKDQQEFFIQFEKDLFYLLAKYLIPYWRMNQMLNPEINKEFSPQFELQIILREPKATMTEREQIELSKLKLLPNQPLSTLKRELGALNPDMTEQNIEDLEREIMEEQAMQNIISTDALTADANQSANQGMNPKMAPEEMKTMMDNMDTEGN